MDQRIDNINQWRSGGIGRHAGLKIQWAVMSVTVRVRPALQKFDTMKELDEMKDGKFFTDDNGLVIYWQPVMDRVRYPEGKIVFRSKDGQPLIAFRVLSNKFDFEGEVKISDEEGEIILNIEKDNDFIGSSDVTWK